MASSTAPPSDNWDANTYSNVVAPFVAKLTTRVVSLLDLQPNDKLLDLGCGDGILTQDLAAKCQHTTGLDSSATMIAACPSSPHTFYQVGTALTPPHLPTAPYSKIFSNAALHWILRCPPSQRAPFFAHAFSLLLPGGAFVAECGGAGNIGDVHAAVLAALIHRGVTAEAARESCPWWFGDEGEYRGLLEGAGFVVEVLETELRQTELTVGKGGGVGGWVRLFAADMLECLKSDEERDSAVSEVESVLEGVGRRGAGGMWVNYIRLRFVARRPLV